MSSGDTEQVDEDDRQAGEVASRHVSSKYMAAAQVLNDTIHEVMAECTPGARVLGICKLGDLTITKRLEQVYKKGCKEKGIAFPTCISVNSEACNVCPLEDDETELQEKDIVRIEMACHIDGLVVSQVQTLVVTASPLTDSVAGRVADVICAVNKAREIVSDIVEPGTKMEHFNEIIKDVAACFRCKVLETSGCRLLKAYEAKDTSCSIPDDGEFMRDTAYMVDIAFVSEHGEIEVSDESETTVYRIKDDDYEASDETLPIFNEIKQKFPKMPFCVRSLDTFTPARISACTRLDILQPYPVL